MAGTAAVANLPLTFVRTLSAHNGPVNAVTFNSTGRYALTAGADKIITLWNPFRSAPQNDESTGALVIHQFAGHGYEVVDVAVSEDNKLIASVGGDRAAFVWDVATGRINRKLFGHEQRLSAVALNVDATVLFTGSHDKSVRVWDLRAQSRSVRMRAKNAFIGHCALRVCLPPALFAQPIQVMEDFHDNVTSILEVRDAAGCSSCITASSLDGTVRTYDMRAGKCLTDSLGAPVGAIALSHDRNCILAALPSKSAAAATGGGGDLLLLERGGGSVLNRYSGSGHLHSVYRIIPALTSTDSHVIAPSEDGNVRFFDLVDGEGGVVRHPWGYCTPPGPPPLPPLQQVPRLLRLRRTNGQCRPSPSTHRLCILFC